MGRTKQLFLSQGGVDSFGISAHSLSQLNLVMSMSLKVLPLSKKWKKINHGIDVRIK